MFMVIGGRGYHAVRVRTILHSWARCAKHVLVFTDPSADTSGYASDHRYVYVAAGDAWSQRPYLPMTHMGTISKILTRPKTSAAGIQWFFLVTDRTFVDVRALLRLLPPLDPAAKGYYGASANATHKEAFGFHDYIDLNMGVLLSAKLLERVVDPEECHDQKTGGGTFDMFDAKLGNCVFYLDATPTALDGIREADIPEGCEEGGGVGGIVSFGKVEPEQMARLATCASLISPERSKTLLKAIAASERPSLAHSNIAVHVMARETRLKQIVDSCEATWAHKVAKVYYHADRDVALESKYALSRGSKWALSRNLATADVLALDGSARKHRVAGLHLPPRPASGGGEHWTISHDKGMGWNTWLRFKMRAIFEWSIKAPWTELSDVSWYFYIDDDTYVLPDALLELLQKYDPEEAHYFGRPLQEEGFPAFVGGGAGIVLSKGAARLVSLMLANPECDPLNAKWNERIHQGGDAWLGDCAQWSGITVDMEYGFYAQPPVADLFHLYADAVAFHGVEDHAAMHKSLAHWRTQNETSRQLHFQKKYDPRCVPVFLNHRYTCLPHFVIGGVPKAGTTSLYKYLLQHPEVVPAKDKELTFWGNFFSPKRRPGREEVMTEYLDKFPYIAPSDYKVTGEATPGYLFCLTCPTYILKYMPKVRILFTLRNPVVRAYSEYLNKKVDRTVMRYLHKRIDNKMDKELTSKAPPFGRLVEDVAKTMSLCKEPNRTYSMMDEYEDDQERDHCYVNPFVGEGRYARYLKNWLEVVPRSQLMLLNFDEWTDRPAMAMRRVFAFLKLARYDKIAIEQAHNTHMARSVHVAVEGASNLSDVKAKPVDEALTLRAHCILHEFYRPFQAELDALLSENGYRPMRWDTRRKSNGKVCPPASQWIKVGRWPAHVTRGLPKESAIGGRGGGGEVVPELMGGGDGLIDGGGGGGGGGSNDDDAAADEAEADADVVVEEGRRSKGGSSKGGGGGGGGGGEKKKKDKKSSGKGSSSSSKSKKGGDGKKGSSAGKGKGGGGGGGGGGKGKQLKLEPFKHEDEEEEGR